jgi:hypothetical protein
MQSWLADMGYTEVVNGTIMNSTRPKNARNVVEARSLDNLREADRRYRNGEKVCLHICASMLVARNRQDAAAGGSADHFIVLASLIEIGAVVQFKLFTWGAFQLLPFRLTPEEFMNSYYGYVAARR